MIERRSPEKVVAAAAPRTGDEAAFTNAAMQYRRELQVHCYRMLGSFHDAEDAVQETLLRAWRYRDSLTESAPLRPWLYRIATNACLDAIKRDRRRVNLRASAENGATNAAAEISWLEPYPDVLLEPVAPRQSEPDAQIITKENIELAFLTVIQLLTPQQRAALILRDVLDWSARETAELLEMSVAATNGALQRARTTLRRHLPARGREWPAGTDATQAERELLGKYIEASEKPDPSAFAAIIREDAIFRMPPDPTFVTGRDAMIKLWVDGGFGDASIGSIRCALTRANRQPAVANYVRKPGDSAYRAMALDVLQVRNGLITEIIAFGPDVFASFGLPAVL